jgi:hypothetical protein
MNRLEEQQRALEAKRAALAKQKQQQAAPWELFPNPK